MRTDFPASAHRSRSMSRRSTKILKAALAAVHYSGAESILAPFTKGAGVVFMLHQVLPNPPRPFEPNRILRVTPDFLGSVIKSTRDADFDIISLDDVPDRLQQGGDRPFAVFTLDDGYRDNREFAYPIFKRNSVPFTIYVASDFADGNPDLWWLTLEEVLRVAPQITLGMNGRGRRFPLRTAAEKEAAYYEIYWWLRSIPEDLARAVVTELAAIQNYDPKSAQADMFMSWDELRELVEDPLVTIGAHTTTHRALGKLPEAVARAEIADSVARIERELGRPCRHLSYPYGCASSAGPREFRIAHELGLSTAVTTQKGLLRPEHAHALTGLPRLSLHGDFQDTRYVKALLSGVPFAFMNALERFAGQQSSAA
jgi:peptidoglycan/xylan/chitin deacetylase (PgdA/CDA1 family)